MDRLQAAEIDYPLVAIPGGQEAALAGLLDCILYVQPDDTPVVVAPPSGIYGIGAWFGERRDSGGAPQVSFDVYVAIASDADIIDTTQDVPDGSLVVYKKTFDVTITAVGEIMTVLADDGRSVLILDTRKLTTLAPGTTALTALVEPARVAASVRRLKQVRLYNEYRKYDPTERDNLPPDTLEADVAEGGTVIFNDGYNCDVEYDEATKTLRFTGGQGLGLGLPDGIPWDDTSEDFEEGIRLINGINNLGEVPMEQGGSVQLDGSTPGQLVITVDWWIP